MSLVITAYVHFLIAVTNNSAILGAISNCTRVVTYTTQPVEIRQNINTREKGLARVDILANSYRLSYL